MIAATVLYLLTLDNGLRPDELTGGDLITHQYAQLEARPSNAPGYPLYTVGGWLWFRIGQALFGWALNPIEVLSLYSTLWAIASLVILFLILTDVVAIRQLMAVLLTAFYATTFFFWYYSITTEQYTSAVFQTLLVIWLAFRWDKDPRDSTLFWLALISGTMLANMVTTVFILAPLLWFVFIRQTPNGLLLFGYLRRPGFLLKAGALALLPLLSYTFIYVRGVQHPEWRGAGFWPTHGSWFLDFITIQQGRDELAPGLTLQTIVTAEFPTLMVQELTWLVFVGGLVGLACLGRRRAIFLYSTLFIYLIFAWGYRFGNWFQVIIPAYPIFIIGFGAGLMRTSSWVRQHVPDLSFKGIAPRLSQSSSIISVVVILLLAGLVVYRLLTNLPQANQHNLAWDTGLDPGWAIVNDDPASPAIISGSFEERVALQYLQATWHVLPDIVPADLENFRPGSEQEPGDRAFFISRAAAAAAPEAIPPGLVYPQAIGEQLIALPPAPASQLPSSANATRVRFGQALELAGWEQVEANTKLPADVARRISPSNWQIALYWQPAARISENYTISVRPLSMGQIIMMGEVAAIQDHQPVWGVYPTSSWRPGEVVRDVYAISLPPGVAPDAVQIIAYRATGSGFENLGEKIIDLAHRDP